MPFKYSCFISYQHSQELVQTFVNQLYKVLSRELELSGELPVYLDRDDRIRPGEAWEHALSTALCESVCLVPVFTPIYFSQQNTYGAREYLAMESLEAQRLEALSLKQKEVGLILPVVLRGAGRIPTEIKSRRSYLDLSDYLLIDGELSSRPAYYSKITELARTISELHELMRKMPEDPCRNCGEFKLPPVAEATKWAQRLSVSKPSLPFSIR